MKRTWLMMLLGAAALVSCSKDNLTGGASDGEATVSLRASLPGAIQTYASHEGGLDGVEGKHLRYVLEVHDGDQVVTRQSVTKPTDDGTCKNVDFELRLPAKAYTFSLWADIVDAAEGADNKFYDTDANGLKHIPFDNACLNEEQADAYAAKETIDLSAGSVEKAVTLTRPFGKVRVITNDVQHATAKPASIKISYGTEVPNAFCCLTCSPVAGQTEKRNLTCDVATEDPDDPAYGDVDGQSLRQVLAFDYLLPAAEAQSMVIEITDEQGNVIRHEVSPVPVVANKLTTLSGNLMTRGAEITVTVDDEFAGTLESAVVETVEALQSKINQAVEGDGPGTMSIVYEGALSEDLSLQIPTTNFMKPGGLNLTLTLPVTDKKIVLVQQGDNGDYFFPKVNLKTAAAPEIDVTGLTHEDAQVTLSSGEDTAVGKILAGTADVEIYDNEAGTAVGTVDRDAAAPGELTWHISEAPASLMNAMANKADHIVLGEGEYGAAVTRAAASVIEVAYPVTFSGVSADASVFAARFNLTAPATFENLQVHSVVPVASEGVIMVANESKLTLDGVMVRSDAGSAATHAVISFWDGAASAKSVEMDMKNSTLEVWGVSSARAIQVFVGDPATASNYYKTKMTMDVQDSRILLTNSETQNFGYSRGFSIFDTAEGSVLNIVNTEVSAPAYPININRTDGLTVNIDGSTLKGYCAMNIWSQNTTIAATNSTFYGRNLYSDSEWNHFQTIVLNGDDANVDQINHANGNRLTFTDCEIIADAQGKCDQTPFSIRYVKDNTIELRGNTKVVDKSKRQTSMVAYNWGGRAATETYNNKLVCDPTVTLEGNLHTLTLDGRYKVGDYYSFYRCRGIVYKVDESGYNGMAMSLDGKRAVWGPVGEAVGVSGYEDGYEKTMKVQQVADWETKYPGFAWVYDFHRQQYIDYDPKLDSQCWFVPALDEVFEIYAAMRGADGMGDPAWFNEKIEAYGGTPVTIMDPKEGLAGMIWSSSESSTAPATLAKSLAFGQDGVAQVEGGYGLSSDKSAAYGEFRGVFEF